MTRNPEGIKYKFIGFMYIHRCIRGVCPRGVSLAVIIIEHLSNIYLEKGRYKMVFLKKFVLPHWDSLLELIAMTLRRGLALVDKNNNKITLKNDVFVFCSHIIICV